MRDEQRGYLSGSLSVRRFNRRLHQLGEWPWRSLTVLIELFAGGSVYVLNSLPLPVCRRVRARRCRKVRGRDYCGYCSAKKEKFFGLPVAFDLLPAAYHDLTPMHELTFVLPDGVCVYTDKAYNSAPDEASLLTESVVRLMPMRKANMPSYSWADEFDLRHYRHTIETFNSQFEKWAWSAYMLARTLVLT